MYAKIRYNEEFVKISLLGGRMSLFIVYDDNKQD